MGSPGMVDTFRHCPDALRKESRECYQKSLSVQLSLEIVLAEENYLSHSEAFYLAQPMPSD